MSTLIISRKTHRLTKIELLRQFYLDTTPLQDNLLCPSLEGSLCSYALFLELQETKSSNAVLKLAYDDYKDRYERNRFNKYFKLHKDESWFKEKYDPVYISKLTKHKENAVFRLRANFLSRLKAGMFKGIKMTLTDEIKRNTTVKLAFESNEIVEQTDKSEVNLENNPFFCFVPDRNALFASSVGTNVSRLDLMDVLVTMQGFVDLHLSEPMKANNYCRLCWIVFETVDDMNVALSTISAKLLKEKDILISFLPSKSTSKTTLKIRYNESSDRIAVDLENAVKVINKLDELYGGNVTR